MNSMEHHRTGFASAYGPMLALAVVLGGCASGLPGAASEKASAVRFAPTALGPDGPPGVARQPGPSRLGATDVTNLNTPVRGFAQAQVIDTRTIPQVQQDPFPGEARLVRDHLPRHQKPKPAGDGEPNELRAEPTLDEVRTNVKSLFPAISATGWNPPDPTLAVGPGHVVVTVNSRVAFYTKAGAQTFAAPLDSSGGPGFFEPLGAGGFCFDPKCFFDQYAQRFVVVVLETYGTTEAWVDIAVSDDADPNGTWYKYRTDAVLTIGTSTAWWDFPGIGYDQSAWYVTGNLFGLNPDSGYYGFGLRVFDKASMLAGGTAAYSTLRNPGYVVQPALHFGTPSHAYLVTYNNSTSLTVYAVNNPLTTPTLSSVNVTVPSAPGAVESPTLNGSNVSNAGMTMPMWRNGKLYVCHNAQVGGRNVARWHELGTGTWPTSGTVARLQSGDIDAGGQNWTLFPAIGVNGLGELGVALGVTSAGTRVGVAVAGRKATDPPGRMGEPLLVKAGDSDGGGRWGDYYAVAIDPSDDTTFWGVGEYRGTSNWQTWVSSFTVGSMSPCHAVADHAGTVSTPAPALAVDVLINDWHSTGVPVTIQSFSLTSTRGGTITRSVGTGPGGRDRLLYAPPNGISALDSFQYTIADGSGATATTAVTVQVLDPATFRGADLPSFTAAGAAVSYYDLSTPTVVPNFAALSPFDTDVVPNINFASTNGVFSTSNRSDNVGAAYDGYVTVGADNLYTFTVESDDGSKLSVGSTLLINNDGLHGMTERAGSIGLKAGKHRVRVEFFEAGGGAGLIVRFQPLGGSKVVVPASAWSHALPCEPDFNGTGGLTVQDVFSFLAAWFAGAPSADFNHAGGITVADIFAFLTAWFAGC